MTVDVRSLYQRTLRESRLLIYLCLIGLQSVGAVAILWNALPIYREILLDPGREAYATLTSSLWTWVAVLAVQGAYWFRIMRVPVPVRVPNIVASHAILFVARLSFIFGGALFSAVFFRHLPEIDFIPAVGGILARGALLFAVLFSLFCCTLEWERLANALKDPNRS